MSETVKTTDGHQGELLCIKGNTAFIKENNGKVWYCPKTDIIENYDTEERQIHDLQQQLDQQKVMWNELKEWVSFTQPKNINDEFISGVCSAYSNVIDKMQELEGEKDDI